MKQKKHHTASAEETLALARNLAAEVRGGDVLALMGPLGAGKTVFAKGIISGLTQVPVDEITSPTFTLIEEYPGNPPVHHVDLYRLETEQEMDDLPWDDLFNGEGVTLLEWAEKAPQVIKHCQWEIKFSKQNKEERIIEITHKGTP